MSWRWARPWALDELADWSIPLDTLVWRLFNEEEEVRLLHGCVAGARLPLLARLYRVGPVEIPAGGAAVDG